MRGQIKIKMAIFSVLAIILPISMMPCAIATCEGQGYDCWYNLGYDYGYSFGIQGFDAVPGGNNILLLRWEAEAAGYPDAVPKGVDNGYIAGYREYQQKHPNPVANFSTNVTNGPAPLTVQFTDSSINATGWFWNFGDGNTSNEQNPMHTYSSEGNYTVNHVVENAYGTSSKGAQINVSAPIVSALPVANFTSDVSQGYAPLTVQFMDLSTNASHLEWNFGDKSISTDRTPVHTYSKAGKYTVSLTVKNELGSNIRKISNYIVVKK